jgi:hypothetical protein
MVLAGADRVRQYAAGFHCSPVWWCLYSHLRLPTGGMTASVHHLACYEERGPVFGSDEMRDPCQNMTPERNFSLEALSFCSSPAVAFMGHYHQPNHIPRQLRTFDGPTTASRLTHPSDSVRGLTNEGVQVRVNKELPRVWIRIWSVRLWPGGSRPPLTIPGQHPQYFFLKKTQS